MAQPVSDRFKEALKNTHKSVLKVEFYHNGELLNEFGTGKISRVVSGEVNVEESGERNVRVTLSDPDGEFIPYSFHDEFWYGREMHCYRGIQYPDGTEEYVLMGIFRIYEVRITTSRKNRSITVRGRDKADNVRRAKFSSVYEIAAGTNVATAVRNLLTLGGINKFNFNPTSSVVAKKSYSAGGDPWEAAREIAEEASLQLRFDVQGVAVMQVIPHGDDKTIAWTYDTTDQKGNPILSVERTGTDERIYNHIVITGEGSDSVVHAEAMDTNPASPTNINGPFGHITYRRVVSASTTQAEAQQIANDALIQATRGTEQVSITIIPNPAIDINDVLYVKDFMSRVDNTFIASRFSIPFGRGETMTITSNLRRSSSV